MPSDLTPFLSAATNLAVARKVRTWFRARSILSKITRDGITKIDVLVPHPSPSGEGPTQDELIASVRASMAKLLPEGTTITVIK